MRRDFSLLHDDTPVVLYPNQYNDEHPYPTRAHYLNGFFYCTGDRKGPSYHVTNIDTFFDGFDFWVPGKKAA